MVAEKNPTPRNPGKAEALAVALAGGAELKAAAASLGIGERTAIRWNQTPKFRRRVGTLRRRLTDRTVGLLAASGVHAVKTLLELLKTADSDAVRATAARTILAALPELHEYHELTERIEALERRSSPKRAGGRR